MPKGTFIKKKHFNINFKPSDSIPKPIQKIGMDEAISISVLGASFEKLFCNF